MSNKEVEERKKQILQAADYMVQGLQSGIWGIVGGHIEHPVVASAIMEGAVRLYLNALLIYHDKETAAKYADKMIKELEPFVDCQVDVDEDDWFESQTPQLIELLTAAGEKT